MTRNEVTASIALAWRNVWRNARRTILTLLTILVGSAMIIFMNSFSKGMHDQLIEDTVSQNSGYIQIHEKGYWDNQTMDYAFIPSEKLYKKLDELQNEKKIIGYTPRILADGLISGNNQSSCIRLQGINPKMEEATTSIQSYIYKGRTLKNNNCAEIVIGVTLAENLGVAIDNEISILSQGFDGSIAADRLKIVGIFKSSNPEYDTGLALIPIGRARETFTMFDYIHSIAIRADSLDNIPFIKKELRNVVEPADTEIQDWSDMLPVLRQLLRMSNFKPLIYDTILLLVVAFGILNTIQMTIYERTREFGIMLAIGTQPAQIFIMIIFESLIISLLGLLFGVTLGAGLGYYYHVNPLDLTSISKEMSVWNMSTLKIPANVTWQNLTYTSLTTLIMTLLFSIFPARRAARLKPINAIRQL